MPVTVLEQIVEVIRRLDEPRQLAVLALVTRMHDTPDASLADLDLEDEDAMDAWDGRVKALARARLGDALAELRTLGLIDERGRVVPREQPADMRPESKTSVTT